MLLHYMQLSGYTGSSNVKTVHSIPVQQGGIGHFNSFAFWQFIFGSHVTNH